MHALKARKVSVIKKLIINNNDLFILDNSLRSVTVASRFRENPIYEKTTPLYDVVLERRDVSLLKGITSSYDVIKKTIETIESSDEHTKKTDDKVTEDVQYIEMSSVHIRNMENSGLCSSNIYY